MRRRSVLSFLGFLPLSGRVVARAMPQVDPLSGDKLFADVVKYTSFGDHRTASDPDNRTSLWLRARLERLGFDVELPEIPFPLFVPKKCTLQFGGTTLDIFPAWPIVTTAGTVSGSLIHAAADNVRGKIVVLTPPYRQGSSLTLSGFGDAVMRAAQNGAIGVVIVTAGPTGDIIALNADPARFNWNIPVALVAGRDAPVVAAAAARQMAGGMTVSGRSIPLARGTNVIGHRRGKGRTVVVSTPKSGWFTCAGERGSGIAIWLAMAATLASKTDADLLFVATTGHEIEGAGGEMLLTHQAPAPDAVRLWAHIGANIASNDVEFSASGPLPTKNPYPQRGILVSENLLPLATKCFAGQVGYSAPVDINSPKAVGEVLIYRRKGYRPLIGLVGAHPLHHTRLDKPALATSPAVLEPVAKALADLLLAATV